MTAGSFRRIWVTTDVTTLILLCLQPVTTPVGLLNGFRWMLVAFGNTIVP
jgi:hypothetical protein